MKTKSAGSFALRPGTRRSLSLFVVLGVSIVASGASAQQLELTENELGDRALAYRDAGQLDEAAYTWRRLLRKNPRSAPAYFELSLIYLEQKKDALAKAALFRGMSYASGELEELAVKTFNKYGGVWLISLWKPPTPRATSRKHSMLDAKPGQATPKLSHPRRQV